MVTVPERKELPKTRVDWVVIGKTMLNEYSIMYFNVLLIKFIFSYVSVIYTFVLFNFMSGTIYHLSFY